MTSRYVDPNELTTFGPWHGEAADHCVVESEESDGPRVDVSLWVDGQRVATSLGVRVDEGGGFYWQSPGGPRLEVRVAPARLR